MSKVVIQGNASGTGNFTIAAPNSNTDRTLNLPDEAGTVLTSGGPVTVDSSAPANSLNIDANGYVTRPNVPSFRASLIATQSVTASGSTDIVWDAYSTPSYNLFNNGFTVSSEKWYPPVAGLYMVHAVLRYDNIGSGYIRLSICKNADITGASDGYALVNNPDSSYDFISGSFLAEMTTSDYFNVICHTNTDASWALSPTSTFMGYMIG